MTNPEQQWREGSTFFTDKKEGNDLNAYEQLLGFDRRVLIGKRVLDVGSGSTEKFSRELAKFNKDINVVSLNPDYEYNEKFRKKVTKMPDWQGRSVGFTAQQMPFLDNTFDFIFALNSLTLYAGAGAEHNTINLWLPEIIRVLRPGGEARLGVLGTDWAQWQNLVDEYNVPGVSLRIVKSKSRASAYDQDYLLIHKD